MNKPLSILLDACVGLKELFYETIISSAQSNLISTEILSLKLHLDECYSQIITIGR